MLTMAFLGVYILCYWRFGCISDSEGATKTFNLLILEVYWFFTILHSLISYFPYRWVLLQISWLLCCGQILFLTQQGCTKAFPRLMLHCWQRWSGYLYLYTSPLLLFTNVYYRILCELQCFSIVYLRHMTDYMWPPAYNSWWINIYSPIVLYWISFCAIIDISLCSFLFQQAVMDIMCKVAGTDVQIS